MSRLLITHHTGYTYSENVKPGVHYLHFYPQARAYLTLRDYKIKIDPDPHSVTNRLDPENNLYHQMWFSEPTDRLNIKVDITLDTREFNPFDFLVDVKGARNTQSYKEGTDRYLTPFLREPLQWQELIDFSAQFRNADALIFFNDLNSAIAEKWDHQMRMEENILDPLDCFLNEQGSCRDLARMEMAMLRMNNFAARFVSGYSYVPGVEEGHELHAWVEAYLPGAGWIGMDPSLGLLTTSSYIPVATSFDPMRTMPVQGVFHGKATSELVTNVNISELD